MSDIGNLIRKLADTHEELYLKVARVDEVYTRERVCNVTPLDGSAPILDVGLQAVSSGNTGMILYPRKGSCVVVGFFDRNTGCVLLAEELEQMSVVVGGTEFTLNGEEVKIQLGENAVFLNDKGVRMELGRGKLKLENRLVNFGAVLNELINALTTLTVTTTDGPSGPPINAAEFTAIARKLSALLEE